LVLQGFNSTFFYFCNATEAVCYISIFYFISTPIYVYKEWDILIKELVKKLALSSFIGVVAGLS
jgi:hypothetical protein